MNLLKSFFYQNVIFTLILWGIFYALIYFFFDKYYIVLINYLFPIFFTVSSLSHYVLSKNVSKEMIKFWPYFMVASTLKLLLYMIIIWLFVRNNKSYALPFVAMFFILYVFYTIFEIRNLLKKA